MQVWYSILRELLLTFVFLDAAPFNGKLGFSLHVIETVCSSSLPLVYHHINEPHSRQSSSTNACVVSHDSASHEYDVCQIFRSTCNNGDCSYFS
jgi:hypothetical protein